MPGLELFSSTPAAAAPTTIVEVPATSAPTHEVEMSEPQTSTEVASVPHGLSPAPGVYYNPRLDPKNFLEGPLSWNPATRLRQMLARPGIVVCITSSWLLH